MREAIRKQERIEKKKHVSQMEPPEKVKLHNKLNNIMSNNWDLSNHCLEKLNDRKIYVFRKDILEVLNHYELIEYKTITTDREVRERIIVRDLNKTNGKYNLHVVFDITRMCVISVWLNHCKDRHKSINMSVYDSRLEIL